MKNSRFFARLFLLATLCIGSPSLHSQSVIPIPQEVEQAEGSFTLNANTRLSCNLQGDELEQLLDYLKQQPLLSACLKNGHNTPAGQAGIVLQKLDNAGTRTPESYELRVTPERIHITACTDAGLFYGLQSLMQLATPAGEGQWTVAACHIADQPRFAYRGFMMDVSRHFRTKEFVKKQMDAMARFKLNRLHLHLTDGAGWRIEIKQYPRLTEFAAWRPQAVWKDWWFKGGRQYCEEGTPGAYGGYYTQDDIRELLAYAAERHITIIPEIEMPAHSEEVLAAYPEMSKRCWPPIRKCLARANRIRMPSSASATKRPLSSWKTY